MRILTRIKFLSIFTAAATLVLGAALASAYANFARMRQDAEMINALQSSYFEQSLVRDLYFKFGEPQLVKKLAQNRSQLDGLLLRAEAQFSPRPEQGRLVAAMSANINEAGTLFDRIVDNMRSIKQDKEHRALYKENDLRLSAQLLVKAAQARDDLLLLEDNERLEADRSFLLLTWTTVLFAVALSASTILVLSFAGGLFRRRLAALHKGAKIIAGGRLGYRIESTGSDELTELGEAINSMTVELESHTRALQTEINERRQAQAALDEKATELEAVLAAQEDVVLMYDRAMNVRRANPVFMRHYGFDPAGLNLRDIIARVHCRYPDGRPLVIEEQPTPRAMHGEETRHTPYLVARQNGTEAIVEASSKPVVVAGGTIGAVTVWHDVTESKRAEAALKDSEARIRNIMVHAPIGMGISTPGGIYTEVNNALCAILGYSREELIGRDILALAHPEDAAAVAGEIERLVRGEISACQMEKRYVRKDGRVIWGQITVSVERDAMDAPLYMIRQLEDITPRKEAERQLKLSTQEIEDLYNNAPCGYHSLDMNGYIVRINDTELAWLGCAREEVVGKKKIAEFMTPESAKAFQAQFPLFLQQGAMKNVEREFVRKDGTTFPGMVSATAIFDADGRYLMSRSIVFDISERKKSEETLRTFFTVIEQGPIGVIITDRHADIQYVNPRFTAVTGFAPHEVLGRNLRMFQSGRITQYAYLEMWNALSNGQAWHGEVLNRNKNDHPYWEDVHITPVKDINGTVVNFVLVSADIAERKAAEEKMLHLANYDPLTDLPNRLLVNDRLQQALAGARRDRLHSALMFLDLDRFKPINDTLGHDIGDLVLREAARRMQGCVRESDTVGRIGGDEFVILLPVIETKEDALHVAEKIRIALSLPFSAASYDGLSISSSIGVAIYPDHGADEKSLMKNADIAMYYAKEGGRNTVKLFTPDMHEGGA